MEIILVERLDIVTDWTHVHRPLRKTLQAAALGIYFCDETKWSHAKVQWRKQSAVKYFYIKAKSWQRIWMCHDWASLCGHIPPTYQGLKTIPAGWSGWQRKVNWRNPWQWPSLSQSHTSPGPDLHGYGPWSCCIPKCRNQTEAHYRTCLS